MCGRSAQVILRMTLVDHIQFHISSTMSELDMDGDGKVESKNEIKGDGEDPARSGRTLLDEKLNAEVEECSICMEVIASTRITLECGHCYCSICPLKIQLCALCRKPLPAEKKPSRPRFDHCGG